MTTLTPPRGKQVAVRTEQTVAAPLPDVQVKPVNRREFLNYIWGASQLLLLGQVGAAIVWFALPRFKAGEFGGVFSVDVSDLPPVGGAPRGNAAGKYWLSNTESGAVALSMVCTHLGCLFKWVDVNNRFECPCHGSKFTAAGEYIIGPAPRGLDRFTLTAVTPGGEVASDGLGIVKAEGASTLLINTGKKINGPAIGSGGATE